MSFFQKKNKPITPPPIHQEDPVTLSDVIAPPYIGITTDKIDLGEKIAKSFFIFSYPKYLDTGWLSPIINLNTPLDISYFVHPLNNNEILKKLRRKVTEVGSELVERQEKGLVSEPQLNEAYANIESLRQKIITYQSKMFHFGLYITVYEENEEKMKEVESMLREIFESRLIYIKPSLFRQKEGFISSTPYGLDQMDVHTPMDTEPLSTTFPFISFDLSANDGILYGVNNHNNSLILFDRFTLENFNSVVFAKSGSGKSYTIKLEILRYLMRGVDCIVIDPENEYQFLSDAIGGGFFKISLTSEHHINPFDLPMPREGEDPDDVLRSNVINLVGLFRIILGGLTPEEDSMLDQAFTETYAIRDITAQSNPAKWQENIPTMSDFAEVLENISGSESLSRRIKKFTEGTFSKFFNQKTNIEMNKNFVVFGIKDMEESLKPAALYIVMRYIWNAIRTSIKKRILVIDEAWWLMQSDDGASFLFGVAKRGRKYWLGVTAVTQDVEDFLKSSYGKAIITNSSLQLLLKQSAAEIDAVQKTFNLTDNERMLLLDAPVGEGLFFAGKNHVYISVKASYTEDQIITTNPGEVEKIMQQKKELEEA